MQRKHERSDPGLRPDRRRGSTPCWRRSPHRIAQAYRIEAPVLTRARHRQALEEAAASLHRARAATLPELQAEDLRLALRSLGRITGTVDVEDLLDVIFRDFCIGK